MSTNKKDDTVKSNLEKEIKQKRIQSNSKETNRNNKRSKNKNKKRPT